MCDACIECDGCGIGASRSCGADCCEVVPVECCVVCEDDEGAESCDKDFGAVIGIVGGPCCNGDSCGSAGRCGCCEVDAVIAC